MFILITGKSGVGKTELTKEVCERLNLNRAVTYTTRPKRVNEVDGVDYNFVTNEEFNKLDLVAKETIYTKDRGIWLYGLNPKDVLEKDIAVVNPQGVLDLKESFKNVDVSIFDIEIKADTLKRLKRIEKRKDNQTETEKARRFTTDISLFEKYIPYINSINNGTFEEGVDELVSVIKFIKSINK